LPSGGLRSSITQMSDEARFPRERYERAAAKYRPIKTSVLFVAEAPPSSLDRYFYFEDVRHQDSLWVELTKEVFGSEAWGNTRRERSRKREWLRRFQEDGYQLIDAVKEPLDCADAVTKIKEHSQELISEIREIAPSCVVLLKYAVYDVLFDELRRAALPVVDRRLPFPGNGWQKKFHSLFPREVLKGRVATAAAPENPAAHD